MQDIAAAQNIMFEIQIEGYDDTSKIYIQSTDKIDIDLSNMCDVILTEM